MSAGTCSHDNGGAMTPRRDFQTPGVLVEELQADSTSRAVHLLQTTVIEDVQRGVVAHRLIAVIERLKMRPSSDKMIAVTFTGNLQVCLSLQDLAPSRR